MVAVQLQHMKLWFAGKFGNWRLAVYELDQLEANLAELVKRRPQAVDREGIDNQLSALRKSIEEKNVPGFIQGYTELTHECNACHRAMGRDYITVQIPVASPFTDQTFTDQVAEGRTLAHAICAACHVIPDKTSVAPAPGIAAPSTAAPSFSELVQRPSFSDATLRQLLGSNHRRIGSAQAMLNPHLTENQIEQIVAYFEVLKAERGR
jgi:mono/diheme cytochrome c family protein